jgi:hypothetical protein
MGIEPPPNIRDGILVERLVKTMRYVADMRRRQYVVQRKPETEVPHDNPCDLSSISARRDCGPTDRWTPRIRTVNPSRLLQRDFRRDAAAQHPS